MLVRSVCFRNELHEVSAEMQPRGVGFIEADDQHWGDCLGLGSGPMALLSLGNPEPIWALAHLNLGPNA